MSLDQDSFHNHSYNHMDAAHECTKMLPFTHTKKKPQSSSGASNSSLSHV